MTIMYLPLTVLSSTNAIKPPNNDGLVKAITKNWSNLLLPETSYIKQRK